MNRPAKITSATQRPVQSNNIELVLEGKVINVHDGDTVTLLISADKKTNICLQGIDAPELKQKFGAESQKNSNGWAVFSIFNCLLPAIKL